MKNVTVINSTGLIGQLGRIGILLSGLLLLAAQLPAGAQCPGGCIYFVDNPHKQDDFILHDNDQLTINVNVNFVGSILVAGNNVLITNLGELKAGNGDNANNTLTVNAGTSGTVFNNLGVVSTSGVKLNGPATLNNGSANGGTTVVALAAWLGPIGARFVAPVTIHNYALWDGLITSLPASATITNAAAATWTSSLYGATVLNLSNAGSWSGQLSSAPTLPGNPITLANSGTWTGDFSPVGAVSLTNTGIWGTSVVYYIGALTLLNAGTSWNGTLSPGNGTRLALTNTTTWTKGFAFPVAGPNTFVNAAGASATFDAPLSPNAATTLTNNGSMALPLGLSLLPAGASLTNSRGAMLGITGPFTNAGLVSNAGTIAATTTFTNQAGGVITGPAAPLRGSFTAVGVSANAGVFGVVGRLDLCAASNATGFGTQTGTVGAATTFCSGRPLPVELAAFSATAVKGQVQLRWATASERNSARFVVERSATGEAFEAVLEMAAQGNSSGASVYAATDARPLAGTSYYRLRQVDLDGYFAFSPVVAVRSSSGFQPADLYPNPVADRLTVDLSGAPAETCELRVLGLTGQVLRRLPLAGGQVQHVALGSLPAGLYLVQVRTSQGSSTQRLVKQ